MSASVSVNASALHRILGTSGIGGRLLRRKAEQVAAAARVNAAPHGSLSEHIKVEPNGSSAYKVVCDHPAALYVHNGTRRHIIRPRRAGGVLRFRVGGKVVYARYVNHPGYRGDPFLLDALRQFI